MKKAVYSILLLMAVSFIVGFSIVRSNTDLVCPMDAKLCSDGSYVGRAGPDCQFMPCPGEEEGILVSLPKANEKIQSPLIIEGRARGPWYFEADFTAELFDNNDNFLGEAILTAEGDWMTSGFVPFKGEMIFSEPSTLHGTLKFLSSNPSGLAEHQKIFKVQVRF